MAPLLVVALVAGGLFGTGEIVKPHNPKLGTALEGAAIGTAVGGGIGAAVGAGSGVAATLGTSTYEATVGTAAAVGAGAGGTFWPLFSK